MFMSKANSNIMQYFLNIRFLNHQISISIGLKKQKQTCIGRV